MAAHAKAHDANQAAGAFIKDEDYRDVSQFRGSFSGYERNVFYLGMGPGKPYVEAAYGWRLDYDTDGRAVAPLDFDGDGDEDLVLLSVQKLQLLRNEVKGGRWVRLRLVASKTERHALGAAVTVATPAGKQLDQVELTRGFHTQVDPTLHFGLGEATAADVEVRWSSGAVERFPRLAPGATYELTEGSPTPRRIEVPAWPAEAAAPATPRFSLETQAETLEGDRQPLGRRGLPTVVNFWAPWCAACEREMPLLMKLELELNGRVKFVGVTAETKKKQQNLDFMAKHEIGFEQRLANDELVSAFFGEGGEMPLPATFVFDADGQLLRAFYREVNRDDLVNALNRTRTQTSADDLLTIARAADDAGNTAEALRMLADLAKRSDGDPIMQLQVARSHFRKNRFDLALEQVERVLARTPDLVDALAFKAAILGASGRAAEAEGLVNRALELDPKNPEALNNLGMILKGRGDRAGAIRAFEAAVALDPALKTARRNLAELGRPARPPGP